MSHFRALAAVLIGAAVAFPLSAVAQVAAVAKAPPVSKTREQMLEIMRLLDTTIETKALHEPIKMKLALEYFSDKFGGKLPILVVKEGFIETEPDADPYEIDVRLPPVPSKMMMRTAMDMIVAQGTRGRGVYVVRPGYIAIIPVAHNTSSHLLQSPVTAYHLRRPLSEVIEDLADGSGLAINIDFRVGDKASVPITATFRNTSLEDALVTVTESAGLKFVVLHNSVLVTTPAHARVITKEEAARKARRQMEGPAAP